MKRQQEETLREKLARGAAITNRIKRARAEKRGAFVSLKVPAAVLAAIDRRRGDRPRWQAVAEAFGVDTQV